MIHGLSIFDSGDNGSPDLRTETVGNGEGKRTADLKNSNGARTFVEVITL